MSVKKTDIICPNTVINCDNEKTLLVYCAVQSILRFNSGVKLITPINIGYEMGVTIPLRPNKKRDILNALDDLCDLGLAEKGTGETYLIDTNLFYNQPAGFEKLDFDIYNKLKHSAGLLKHYILIKRGFINNVCNFSLEHFAEKEHISTQTVSTRNKKLLDLELIYMYQQTYNEKTGQYGRNAYMIFDPTRNFVKEKNYSNLNRKVSQRYNAFVRNPDNFTPLEIKGLRKQVEEYNVRNPERQKDLSVFDL